jgi:hypothetical protein
MVLAAETRKYCKTNRRRIAIRCPKRRWRQGLGRLRAIYVATVRMHTLNLNNAKQDLTFKTKSNPDSDTDQGQSGPANGAKFNLAHA